MSWPSTATARHAAGRRHLMGRKKAGNSASGESVITDIILFDLDIF